MPQYRTTNFHTTPEDAPLIAQICGNNPEIALEACKQLRRLGVNNIDLNLGCPQGIAKRGNYGAYLLEQEELVSSVVHVLAKEGFNVSCKIRLKQEFTSTVKFVLMLERAGCKLVTVHGRRIQDKKQQTEQCNFDAIRELKKYVRIPIIANGGCSSIKDAIRILIYTKADAIMSSEAILE